MFWMMMTKNEAKRFQIEINDKVEDWKVCYLSIFNLEWKEKKECIFKLESPKIIKTVSSSGWRASRTTSFLREDILYQFEVLNLVYIHLVLGLFYLYF
jgi:hypothetical protein